MWAALTSVIAAWACGELGGIFVGNDGVHSLSGLRWATERRCFPNVGLHVMGRGGVS